NLRLACEVNFLISRAKAGQTQIPFRTVLFNANAILCSASRDLSTPAAPNPVDNLEAVAWQPQPGRATGSRSFFEQGKLPRRAAR
ncbi:TPA: hypothetical protein ACTYCJ_000711, partial [Klebsiella pneumoniae]